MRQFDQAQSSLPNQYSLLRGWADLHAAESALLLARRTFDRKLPSVTERLGLIRSKLLSCRTHLHNAMSAVRMGRRNALWWRHCYQLMAQYHAESLQWNLHKLKEISETRPNSQAEEVIRNKRMIAHACELFKRYEKCLDAIVGFADYSLNRNEAFENQWLQRTLSNALCGAATAVHFREDLGGQSKVSFDLIVDEIIEDWKKRHPRAIHSDLEDTIRRSIKASGVRRRP